MTDGQTSSFWSRFAARWCNRPAPPAPAPSSGEEPAPEDQEVERTSEPSPSTDQPSN